MKSFFLYWVPVVLYAGLITVLSSLSKVEGPSFLELNDKLLHAIEYSVLGALCYRAYRYGVGSIESRFAVALAVLSAAVFGITDEYHQTFVPLREADIWDWGADVIGSFFGAIAWYRLQRST